MFRSLVGEPVHLTQRQPDTGLFVVAKTNHVDPTGNVKQQTQDPTKLSPHISIHVPQQRTRRLQDCSEIQHLNTQDETTIVMPHVEIQMLPQPLREPAPHIHPILSQNPFGPASQKSPVLLKHVCPVTEENEISSLLQTHKSNKSRIREQPNTLQSNKTFPQPPIMVRSEVHSKAQSMARSRLEKARCRLQGRIQQAIKLFGGREVSESQAKKKQVNF